MNTDAMRVGERPSGVRDLGMSGHSTHENREIPTAPGMGAASSRTGREGASRTTAVYAMGKSDMGVVLMKPTNKAAPTAAAELVEGWPVTKGNSVQPTGTGTPSPAASSSGLQRVREAAERDKTERFTALMHHITPGLLAESYWSLKRQAAPGLDGVTWDDYGENLYDRILDLHERVQSGRYRAQPSKRAWIPKADGRMRPLGIAALEDKIVQAATVRVLQAIYEVDFAGFSYGFRPERGQHHALDALWVGISQRPVNWVLDADIAGFFDALDHEWLMKFLGHRIADQRMLRLIQKWLRAGVSEDGAWTKTTVGTPQGAVISPLLANVYMHYVLDLWMKWWRRTQTKGTVIMVRYADDFVIGFERKTDAERFLADMRERFARFGLSLHPDKTRLIEFGKTATTNRERRKEGKPETFDFLGFTHICGKTKDRKRFLLLRKTSVKRVHGIIERISTELRRRRHKPIEEQGRWLKSVVQGIWNYFAVPTNGRCLMGIRSRINMVWHHNLSRRSHKAHIRWDTMLSIVRRWIPTVRIIHPYPSARLQLATYPR